MGGPRAKSNLDMSFYWVNSVFKMYITYQFKNQEISS